MTPLMVSLLASGAKITIHGLPMFVSIIETVIVPVAIGFVLNYALGKNKTFKELQKVMPGVAVLGLACVVGGVISSQGSKFFQSGAVIFIAVLLHNGLGYFLGYCAGRLTGMNTAKKRTILSKLVCRMPVLQQTLQQQLHSLLLHQNPQSSVLFPVYGILFQEHYWQDYLPSMIK